MKIYKSQNMVTFEDEDGVRSFPNSMLSMNAQNNGQITISVSGVSVFDGTYTQLTDENDVPFGSLPQTVDALRGLLNFKTAVGRVITVDSPDSLPTAVAGVITFNEPVVLNVVSDVAIQARIYTEHPIVIKGEGAEVCFLRYNGTGAFLTAKNTVTLTGVTFQASEMFDLDAQSVPNAAIDWTLVNFLNISNLGTIKNYNNAIFFLVGFLNSNNLVFDGTFNTIAFDTTIFQPTAGIALTIAPTCVINRRIRIQFCAFPTPLGVTAINCSVNAVIPVESYVLFRNNFSGAGTYLLGVQPLDNKSDFTANKGISNSASVAKYSMLNNATQTPIPVANAFYKIQGTTVAGALVQRFQLSNNRAQYTGAITGIFKVSAIISASAGTNQTLAFRIGKNGTTLTGSEQQVNTSGSNRSENVKVQDLLELSTNDYVEVFVSNTATTAVIATELNLIIEQIS